MRMKRLLIVFIIISVSISMLSADGSVSIGLSLRNTPASYEFGFTDMTEIPTRGEISEVESVDMTYDAVTGGISGSVNMYYRLVNAANTDFYISCTPLSNDVNSIGYAINIDDENAADTMILPGDEETLVYQYAPLILVTAGVVPLRLETLGSSGLPAGEYSGSVILKVQSV